MFAGRTGLSQGLIDHDNQLCKVNFTSTRTLFAQSITQVTNVKGFASLRHQEEGNTILGSTCQLPLIIITHCLPKKPSNFGLVLLYNIFRYICFEFHNFCL